MPTKNKEWEREFANLELKDEFGSIEHVDSNARQQIKSFITSQINKAYREGLEDYTRWLVKNHYTDSDVYTEEPKAVDRFLAEITN